MSHTSQQNIAFHPSGVHCKKPTNTKIKFNTTQNTQVSTFPCSIALQEWKSFFYVTLSVHFALNPPRILGQNQNPPLYTANVPSRIPHTTLTSRNARTYKPLKAKFTETHNSKSQQKKFPEPRNSNLRWEGEVWKSAIPPQPSREHGKTPNPP